MKTCTSISGGQTSAYLATHYPTDYNIFALVRIEDEDCKFPDPTLRARVEDRIQKPFIGTSEDDMIIYTLFDLEQFLGKEITWVSGITFEEVLRTKGGWLPNVLHRFCTTELKIVPMFEQWYHHWGPEPLEMQIGYRANEEIRAVSMLDNTVNGLNTLHYPVGIHPSGRKKWADIGWQSPVFPLINDRIFKSDIQSYWLDKPVRFAEKNNCIGCFHRHPLLLKKMQQKHPKKFRWFAKQEEGCKRGTWRSDVRYENIEKFQPQYEIEFSEFSACDSGFCGL
jgi:hypothetical protein